MVFVHYKLRCFSVEALRFWQNGRLNVNESRESNSEVVCLIIILFLMILIYSSFNSFSVLNRFLCLKTSSIYDQLLTWDKQEL